jgi:hypothetical protein
MPSLDQFESYFAPGGDAVKTAIQTGVVTPDTNVMLHFYRFQPEARDELFGALEKLGDRLWVPHQVGLEFHRNRLMVMHEQENYFSKTRGEIDTTIKILYGQVRAFGRRIGMDEDRIENITDSIDMLNTNLIDEIAKAEEANVVRLDGHGSDEILPRIHALFRDRVGGPMEPQELEEALQEAVRRVTDKIPPGYKDNDKGDPSGDYLVWRQLMNEARVRKLPVVFITDDAKPDWYQEYKGRTIGARRELREEMAREAGVPLIIMTTRTFLLRAPDDLDAEVSPETIAQADELPGRSDFRTLTLSTPLAWRVQAASATRQKWFDDFVRELATHVEDLSPVEQAEVERFLAVESIKGLPEDDRSRLDALAEYFRLAAPDGGGDEATDLLVTALKSERSKADAARVLRRALVLLMRRGEVTEEPPQMDD